MLRVRHKEASDFRVTSQRVSHVAQDRGLFVDEAGVGEVRVGLAFNSGAWGSWVFLSQVRGGMAGPGWASTNEAERSEERAGHATAHRLKPK